MKIVHLDYGHGGKDPGALGNGIKEKDKVLSVGGKATKILEQHNVKVIHSRTTDVFIELHERANMANKAKADVFVSIHCNAFSDPKAQGVEVFSYPNSMDGKKLSQSILDSIIKDKLYTKNRGVKTANFAVLRLTKMTAALVELGFITNVSDSRILKNKQDELAVAVAKGVLGYLGIAYKVNSVIKKDDPYEKVVQELMLADIIGSPAAWLDIKKVTVNNMKSLIIKFAKKIDGNFKDYNGAVDVLVAAKIISNRQAWNENSISIKNAAPLIIKMAAYMTQGV